MATPPIYRGTTTFSIRLGDGAGTLELTIYEAEDYWAYKLYGSGGRRIRSEERSLATEDGQLHKEELASLLGALTSEPVRQELKKELLAILKSSQLGRRMEAESDDTDESGED